MASKNVQTHRDAHEAWNARELDAVVEKMTSSITYTDHARGLTIRTRDDFKEWVQDWAQMFSNGKIVDQKYADAGNTTVARFTGRGTNDGPFGPFSATGREVRFDVCEILEYDDQGTIVGGDVYYDQLSILVQLGHVEAPAAAAVQP
jgi:nuclear transport factor 2 (NTF2) superfamily protein